MSESFLSEIADQLRNQTPPADTAPANPSPTDQPADPTPADDVPADNINQVNDQITDSVTSGKEWYEKDETNVPVDKNTTSPNEAKESTFELDEDLKLISEYKKSGKTLADFVKEYQVEDFSTWADEKIVEEGLKNFMNLEQEEMEQALYDFKSSSVFQKKQLVESFREKFERKNEEKLKQLKGSNADLEAKTQAITAKYQSDLNNYAQQIANKEMYGLKITDEMSSRLKEYIDKEFSIQRADGSFDIEKVYDIALWLNYGADLVKANVTKAKNEGREQVIKEVTNPSRNTTSSGKLVSSGLEAVQDAFNTLFPG